MAQINSGVRALLSFPGLYDLWSQAVGANNAWSELARLYLRLKPGQSLLDMGCGTAGIIKHLPNGVSYTGFDLSPGYIAKARVRFGRRGTFICGSVADHIALPIFDVAMAYGVLHHLDDTEAERLFALAARSLKSGGRLVTVDPALGLAGQSRLSQWVISRDRGQNVRRQDEYEALARRTFANISSTVRHDLLRIPYTHLIMECS